jgi:galactonate dehydratase
MRVTRVEVVWPSSIGPAPFFFVLVHTDAGLVGLGQTADPRRTIPVVLEWSERFLIGRDPLERSRLWSNVFEHASYHGYSGAELRALSALDIALWDVAGKVANLPIYQLLGGRIRDRIRIYNTCSSYRDRDDGALTVSQPERLAEKLLAKSIGAYKYAPFDHLADATHGQALDDAGLDEALEPIRAVQRAFGREMAVAIEGHGKWNLTAATQLARRLETEGLNILWLEDLLRPENPEQLGRLRERIAFPLAGSELLFTRWQFLPLLQAGGTDVGIADISWCGGISELHRLASLTDVYKLPLAPHDHTGPVAYQATTHVVAAISNALVMESTRVFYETYYPELVDPAPEIHDGYVWLPEGPGLGLRLREAVFQRDDLVRDATETAGTGGFAP